MVYEADLGVHLSLVANNNLIIFTDPDTDPYPSGCDGTGGADCSSGYMNANPGVLSTRIGNANFDIGHVVTRVYGGVANLSSVCGSNKAAAASGIPRGGDIDPLTALVVIHEMGHQFGANHTFSGTRGRCQGNVNVSTAWEAGSGSSPMAYPGGCPVVGVGDAPPSDNVAQFADPFFHHGSYGEMRTFLNSGVGGAACAVQSSTTNNIPVVGTSTPSTSIPPGTPFVLSAGASDADSEPLTYSWEEYDSGATRPLSGAGSEDTGAGALFRVFPPVSSPQRVFPRMADILAGLATPGERLPTATGVTRHFRVIVRDNHAGAGGVAVSPYTHLSIPSAATPFTVTAPAEGVVLRPGPTQVSWTVGGTDAAPISCGMVTIRLSTDDGATFAQTLGDFPNTGAATVAMPQATAAGRVRIDGVGQVFFAVSRPFLLRPACTSDFNHDGDAGTDSDIQDFFACLAGNCCAACGSADYNDDGDSGTDADIEAFFRVLAGGSC